MSIQYEIQDDSQIIQRRRSPPNFKIYSLKSTNLLLSTIITLILLPLITNISVHSFSHSYPFHQHMSNSKSMIPTFSQNMNRPSSFLQMYIQSKSSTSTQQSGQKNNRQTNSSLPYSKSRPSSTNALPPSSIANGLLSPETVFRFVQMTSTEENEVLGNFLKTYRNDGLMACLSMLSDPNVLPYLTEAMRDLS